MADENPFRDPFGRELDRGGRVERVVELLARGVRRVLMTEVVEGLASSGDKSVDETGGARH